MELLSSTVPAFVSASYAFTDELLSYAVLLRNKLSYVSASVSASVAFTFDSASSRTYLSPCLVSNHGLVMPVVAWFFFCSDTMMT